MGNLVQGINFITGDCTANQKCVANLSLGIGAPNQLLDDTVKGAVNSGVAVVIAAGNDKADACNDSPARVTEAITVGATDSRDGKWRFSNYGDVSLALTAPIAPRLANE